MDMFTTLQPIRPNVFYVLDNCACNTLMNLFVKGEIDYSNKNYSLFVAKGPVNQFKKSQPFEVGRKHHKKGG